MTTLGRLTGAAGPSPERRLCGLDSEVGIDTLVSGAWLDVPIDRLRGRSVLIATDGQFATACALVACDGVARRLVICPPGLPEEQLAAIATIAEVDAVLCDDAAANPCPGVEAFAVSRFPGAFVPPAATVDDRPATEWVLPTSGTSGSPKLVIHTLRTLAGAMTGSRLGTGAVWSSFYDIRRYGGLQIFLRAMIGGGSMILSSATESATAFLERAGRRGVTHISGTPSHWRRALMSPACSRFAPRYVRLSGEIADQSILDRLHAAFPDAAISHAFASTEAGVAFDVVDGLAGFPATLIGGDGGIALRVEDGSLRIRSDRVAMRYLGDAAPPIADPDGFVDTGDMVERHQDRYLFVGRRSGIINVGGLKIHPEEIEAAIAAHPRVRMCVVRARRSPITGAIVTADIVTDAVDDDPRAIKALQDEILAHCRSRLGRHKVPVSIRLVPTIDIAVSGKMRR